jgi:hypothetical protein
LGELEVDFSNELVLCLTFLFPVPALNLKFLLEIVLADEFTDGDFYGVPAWIEIFLDDCGAGDLNESVVLPDFEELEVGVALVPPVEPRVGVHEFEGLPFHGDEL